MGPRKHITESKHKVNDSSSMVTSLVNMRKIQKTQKTLLICEENAGNAENAENHGKLWKTQVFLGVVAIDLILYTLPKVQSSQHRFLC